MKINKQTKITTHDDDEEKDRSIETGPELTQMLELIDTSIKTILKLYSVLKKVRRK